MTRHLITLALALGLSAVGSTALAGKRCPWNDKEEPENARICKAGTLQVCKDGQWVSLGTKCSAKFRDDDRADASAISSSVAFGAAQGRAQPRAPRTLPHPRRS